MVPLGIKPRIVEAGLRTATLWNHNTIASFLKKKRLCVLVKVLTCLSVLKSSSDHLRMILNSRLKHMCDHL